MRLRLNLLGVALLCGLVQTVALAQTVYSWVDEKGEEHFTDDPSSIPKAARRRTREGASISTVAHGAVDAGVAPPAVVAPPPSDQDGRRPHDPEGPSKFELTWRGLFREAHERVATLELAIEQDRRALDGNAYPMQLRCNFPRAAGCVYLPSPEYEAAKNRLESNRAALARAKTELEDLDRRASLASVPREWR